MDKHNHMFEPNSTSQNYVSSTNMIWEDIIFQHRSYSLLYHVNYLLHIHDHHVHHIQHTPFYGNHILQILLSLISRLYLHSNHLTLFLYLLLLIIYHHYIILQPLLPQLFTEGAHFQANTRKLYQIFSW